MKRPLFYSILLGTMMLLTLPAYAQGWTILPTECWAYEWFSADEQTGGPALANENGEYKAYVRGGAGLNPWDTEFVVTFGEENALKVGDMLSVTFTVKADRNVTLGTQSHTAPGAYLHYTCIGNVDATTSWEQHSLEAKVSEQMDGIYSVAFLLTDGQENNVYFKDIQVKVIRSALIEWTDIIVNGDMEGANKECFYVTEQGIGGPFLANITGGIGKDGSRAVKVQSADNPAQAWDTQFFIRLPYQLPPECQYRISFDYKADKAGAFDTQSNSEPGDFIYWTCVGSGTFSTEWQHFKAEGSITSDMSKEGQPFQTIAFILAKNMVATQFIFDNVKFEIPSYLIPMLTKNPAVNPEPYPTPLIDEAMALVADDDAVAVGKLREAIEWATNNDESRLQAAIDQFLADNADLEKDETAKVATNGWKDFNGNSAGTCLTQYAPAITTYDGRTAQLAEVYEGSTNGVNRTGTIIYQDITGLANGKYKVGFYGNAFFTSGRGFDSPMFDGTEDVAYVFANDEQAFITSHVATATTENDFRQFDVEVTDGCIRLGMGKAKAGTNWHTMQIYQLTWFTTAKQAYAAVQEELGELFHEARKLYADETKTNGREAFSAAFEAAAAALYSNWYNIPELEAIVANLREAIAAFKKANYFVDFVSGEYYIIDLESELRMAAGHDWGTQGIVNELGLDLTITPNETTRGVTIDSRVSNGGNKHYLGNNLYMDSDECEWFLDYKGSGFYITDGEGQYISINTDNNLVMSDTPREWIIVTAEGVRLQLLDQMENAASGNPVDATLLVKAQGFNRNDARNAEAWMISADCENSTLGGPLYGNVNNYCAESYHSTFTIIQTIPNAPAGLYQLTAQGFYRQDDGAEDDAPVFFMGDATAELPAIAGSENSMADASVSFTSGLYTIAPIEFFYDGKSSLTVGVKGSSLHQWVIFDNFKLTYLGCPKMVYSEYDTYTETLTYYYDGQYGKRPGETNVFDPVKDPTGHSLSAFCERVVEGVINPSMRNAPLTSTSRMFYGFRIMSSIEGMEFLNTANVTDMTDMFSGCQALEWLNLSSFNTSNVQSMNGMFYKCTTLTSLDLCSFDISKVETMRGMFEYCENLKTIYCNEDWSTTTAASDFMFQDCFALEGGKGTTYDSNVWDATYARPDGGEGAKGYFTAETITSVKAIGNGQIDNEGAVYSLAGQRLKKKQKGINIVDGKKILVK